MRTCHIDTDLLARAEQAEGEPIYNHETLVSLSADPENRRRWHGRLKNDEISELAAAAMRDFFA